MFTHFLYILYDFFDSSYTNDAIFTIKTINKIFLITK